MSAELTVVRSPAPVWNATGPRKRLSGADECLHPGGELPVIPPVTFVSHAALQFLDPLGELVVLIGLHCGSHALEVDLGRAQERVGGGRYGAGTGVRITHDRAQPIDQSASQVL